jgi:hypothetical protein
LGQSVARPASDAAAGLADDRERDQSWERGADGDLPQLLDVGKVQAGADGRSRFKSPLAD